MGSPLEREREGIRSEFGLSTFWVLTFRLWTLREDKRMKLANKVALITGAGSGMGKSAALLFASEGAKVAAVDINEVQVRETVATIYADEDVVGRVREFTRGEGADVVVDVTAETMAPIAQAVEMARPGGTIILAGVKGAAATIPDLKNDRIFSKELTIRGVKNADFDSFAIAVKLIEAHEYPFEKMHTHSFALSALERAIQTLAGRVAGEHAVSVSLDPLL